MSAPVHGFCNVCGGRIEKGSGWTLTGEMFRIHDNPDRCIVELHLKQQQLINPMDGVPSSHLFRAHRKHYREVIARVEAKVEY